MKTEQKDTLAMHGDASQEAAGRRITAARRFAGLSQSEMAEAVGITKAAVSNIEKARSFPTRPLMLYLYREHRVDFNFLIYGAYAQLPGDVQAGLLRELEEISRDQGQATS